MKLKTKVFLLIIFLFQAWINAKWIVSKYREREMSIINSAMDQGARKALLELGSYAEKNGVVSIEISNEKGEKRFVKLLLDKGNK